MKKIVTIKNALKNLYPPTSKKKNKIVKIIKYSKELCIDSKHINKKKKNINNFIFYNIYYT